MARHSPPGDRSFWLSVVRHVASATALVAAVAAAFWGIGQLRGPDPTAGGPGPTVESPQPSPPTAAPLASPPAPVATPPPDAGPTPAPPSPQPTAEATTSAPTADVDPAGVTVQILDAVLDGEGTAAAEVAQRLREDGYRIIARNRAIRAYDVTTVFFSPGHEAAARQIAAAYGFQRVAPKPDNLTDSVQVHVVVGADYEAGQA